MWKLLSSWQRRKGTGLSIVAGNCAVRDVLTIARCACVLVVIATLLLIAKVDAKLSAHDLVVVQVAHSGRSRICTRWSEITKIGVS
jgi:hypothetical protein